MSLITMGLGHLTIIPYGLGNSFKIPQTIYTGIIQSGAVEFEEVSTEVEMENESADITIGDEEKQIRTTDTHRGVVNA